MHAHTVIYMFGCS